MAMTGATIETSGTYRWHGLDWDQECDLAWYTHGGTAPPVDCIPHHTRDSAAQAATSAKERPRTCSNQLQQQVPPVRRGSSTADEWCGQCCFATGDGTGASRRKRRSPRPRADRKTRQRHTLYECVCAWRAVDEKEQRGGLGEPAYTFVGETEKKKTGR